MGSMVMPGVGTAVGAIAGAAMGASAENEDEKARKRAETSAEFGGVRPKRRKLQRVKNAINQSMNNKQRALIAMAQAHQNFAAMY